MTWHVWNFVLFLGCFMSLLIVWLVRKFWRQARPRVLREPPWTKMECVQCGTENAVVDLTLSDQKRMELAGERFGCYECRGALVPKPLSGRRIGHAIVCGDDRSMERR